MTSVIHVAKFRKTPLRSRGKTNEADAQGGEGAIEEQARAMHGRLKAVIISHTGHEQDAHDRSDNERYYAHRALIKELNEQLMLGLDKKDQELISLIHTSLSYTNRFEGDPYILPKEGESPVKHSAHAAIDYVLSCYQAKVGRTQDEKLAICRGGEFQTIARQGALTALWHDTDEVFGEPSTVHNRAVTGQTEQDASQGIRVLHYALTRAMHAIEEKERIGNSAPLDVFFAECENIRKLADVKKKGFANILAYIKHNPPPRLSEDGKARVAKALRHYAVAEQQLPLWHIITKQEAGVASEPSQLDDFICQSVKSRERNEGNSHYNRFFVNGGVTPQSPRDIGSPSSHLSRILERDRVIPHAEPQSVQRAESNLVSYHGVRADSVSILKNLEYGESKVGAVLASAKTPLQQAVATQCALASYRTIVMLLANGPVMIDRFPEKRANFEERKEAARTIPDQTAFLDDQQRLRKESMDLRREAGSASNSKKQNKLPEIVRRQELISTVLQTMELIKQGEWEKMLLPDGSGKKFRFEGLAKREAPLPPEIDVSKPIPGTVQL